MKAYQMKVTIKNSHPPIWRRFIVPAGLTFSQLGFVINEVMGWYGNHLSQFDFYHLGVLIEEAFDEIGLERSRYDREILDAASTPIEPFMDNEDWFTYVYDLGDDWQHRVEIEKILPEYEYDYPMVLKYKGDTPYEDCGGIYGYYHLLEVLEDPEHPEYEDLKDWVNEFPELGYDLEEVNSLLQRYVLSKETHEPMGKQEIYENIWEGKPLYTILCGDRGTAVREEASLEEWGIVYEAAQKIKKLEPWNRFWDMDLIALEDGNDIAFVVILGRGGECYGVSIYEGIEGLNDFMMLCNREKLGLSENYVALTQNNLTCYWGAREELSSEQYEIMKSLGYKFRGRNAWLYFISNKAGYFPYNMDAAEVKRMSIYLSRLEDALRYYDEKKMHIDFEHGNMFLYYRDEASGSWTGKERPLPFISYQFMKLVIDDERFIRDFCEVPQGDFGLDIHIECLPASIKDEAYERPAAVRMIMVADTDTGMMLGADMIRPDEFDGDVLVKEVVSMIFDSERPREIRVCNEVMKQYLNDLCNMGKIKLKKVKRISVFDKFLKQMERL